MMAAEQPTPNGGAEEGSAEVGRLMRAAAYATLLLMPSSVFFPLAPPLLSGVVKLYVTPGIELVDIPAFLLLQLAALNRFWPSSPQARKPSNPPPGTLSLLPIFLALLAFASAFGALIPRLAWYSGGRWLLAAGVFWGIRQSAVPAQRVASVLGLGLCLHVVVALLQVLHAAPLGLPGELTLPPDAHGAPVLHLGDRPLLRGYGLTFHPNVLGGFLAVALVLLMPLGRQAVVRWLAAVLVLGLVLTLSRSAALALLLAGGPALWRLSREDHEYRRILRRGLILVGCLALVSVPWWWQAVTVRLHPLLSVIGLSSSLGPTARAEEQSLWARGEMNRLAWQAFLEHPLLGVGAGNFPALMLREKSLLLPQYVHNVPLLLAAEVGLFGLLGWLLIPVYATVLLVRGPSHPWLVASCAAAWVVTLIAMFDCYPWSLQAGRLLTVTVLALVESSRTRAAT